jgi:2-dehydropantoate 2-reductase
MTSEDVMVIHILGIGSVGSVCALLLTRGKVNVSILARRPFTPPIIHERGGKVTKLDQIIDDTTGIARINVLLITTKAHQTLAALTTVKNRIAKDTLLVFLQNGMGIVDSVRHLISTDRTVVGTTTMGAYRDGYDVHWVSKGQTHFAPVPSTSLSPAEQKVVSYLGELIPYDTLQERMYLKLAVNACINPVTAVFNLPNACVADTQSQAHELAMRLATEIQSVYAAALPQSDMSQFKELVVKLATDTGENISSMLADIRGGRETEIDFINGYIVEMASKVGIDVPENMDMVRRVKDLRR